MKLPITWSAAIIIVVCNRVDVRAQVPAIPGAAAPAAGGAAVAAPAAAAPSAAAPRNIWSYFLLTPDQKAECAAKRQRCCASAFGQLLNNLVAPLALFSGGVIPQPCGPPGGPSAADLAKPADSAEGAAARIKEDEAGAKARREAVRYLGTVDCHRYPEAEAALILSLRADKNECVRWEAALALGRGCCCTKSTIEALALTVTGSTKDGNPAECSERVRAAAAGALQHCLSCYREPAPTTPPLPRPEAPTGAPVATSVGSAQLPGYYVRIDYQASGPLIEGGRVALSQYRKQRDAQVFLTPGHRSVFEAFSKARQTTPSGAETNGGAAGDTTQAERLSPAADLDTFSAISPATPEPPQAARQIAAAPVSVDRLSVQEDKYQPAATGEIRAAAGAPAANASGTSLSVPPRLAEWRSSETPSPQAPDPLPLRDTQLPASGKRDLFHVLSAALRPAERTADNKATEHNTPGR